MPCLISMTGFGRAEGASELGSFVMEIKSINHRFLELHINLPRDLAALELPLTRIVREKLTRGKVDVFVRWNPSPDLQPRTEFNQSILQHYNLETCRIAKELGRENETVSLEYLLGLPGTTENQSVSIDQTALFALAPETLLRALDVITAERRREGEALDAEIRNRLTQLENLRVAVEARREEVIAIYRDRLRKKAAEWAQMANIQLDPGRLEAEVLLFADRSDVTEELVRLQAHIAAFYAALDGANSEAQGKSLEFLTQELLREANTLASKSRDTSITTSVLGMKNEIEKIREQILNVE